MPRFCSPPWTPFRGCWRSAAVAAPDSVLVGGEGKGPGECQSVVDRGDLDQLSHWGPSQEGRSQLISPSPLAFSQFSRQHLSSEIRSWISFLENGLLLPSPISDNFRWITLAQSHEVKFKGKSQMPKDTHIFLSSWLWLSVSDLRGCWEEMQKVFKVKWVVRSGGLVWACLGFERCLHQNLTVEGLPRWSRG